MVGPVLGQETAHTKLVEKLRSAIEYEVKSKDLPAFSIALVHRDRNVWSAGFGFEDAEKKKPASAQTVYRVGSVSKLFTDAALMQQVVAGKMSLDAPVTQWLPTFKLPSSEASTITLRQLMSHRSGLVREPPIGHYFDPDEPTLSATVESLNTTRLVYEPGTKTKYSNAAIAVVGAALESVTGKPFDETIRERLFQPIGMEHSSFKLDEATKSRAATGWMWSYDGRRFAAPEFALGTAPAGNMFSSAEDLAKPALRHQGHG
ncbi:MAG: serine hydrolase domain-containing protein [Pirellulales bacterium]